MAARFELGQSTRYAFDGISGDAARDFLDLSWLAADRKATIVVRFLRENEQMRIKDELARTLSCGANEYRVVEEVDVQLHPEGHVIARRRSDGRSVLRLNCPIDR